MKNYSNTIIKRMEAKATETGFDKLSYFNEPDTAHKNYWVSDEKTGLTHILLQSLKINTVDTEVYKAEKFNETYWQDDVICNTKRKGNFGYVTAYTYVNGKNKTIRQAKVVTNTVGLGKKIVVDHLNGNTYDNRRINLCTCTQKVNAQNHYPYKEVPAIVYPWDHE